MVADVERGNEDVGIVAVEFHAGSLGVGSDAIETGHVDGCGTAGAIGGANDEVASGLAVNDPADIATTRADIDGVCIDSC